MPIPKPRKNERKDKFISRCISFQMNEESDPKKRSKKRKLNIKTSPIKDLFFCYNNLNGILKTFNYIKFNRKRFL